MTALQAAARQLAKEQKRAKREALELSMLQQIRAVRLEGGMVRQHRFNGDRKWAFDFAWPGRKWALEVEGGTWSGGRHTTGVGFRDDCEKYAAAALAGWRVLRATSDQVSNGTALKWLEEALLPKAMPSILAALDEVNAGELAHGKAKVVRSEKYRRLVAAMPCANCGVHGHSQAAHPNTGKGAGKKVDDNLCFPLCTTHHGPSGDLVQGCHERFDQGAMYSKGERRTLEVKWGRNAADAVKRSGKWPMGLPFPDFKEAP